MGRKKHRRKHKNKHRKTYQQLSFYVDDKDHDSKSKKKISKYKEDNDLFQKETCKLTSDVSVLKEFLRITTISSDNEMTHNPQDTQARKPQDDIDNYRKMYAAAYGIPLDEFEYDIEPTLITYEKPHLLLKDDTPAHLRI